MILTQLKPRKALNKAFLKVKPSRSDIESFKKNLVNLIDQINEAESEEFHKNLVSRFLRETYYGSNHSINTKGWNDLVIHNGKDSKSTVGVILEAKKPTNRSEMIKADNLNTKAFQELLLYYLRERITAKNLEIKYLVATNIYEWFIFDAGIFERIFAQNRALVKQFTDFEERRLSDTRTDFFYKEIAEPAIAAIKSEITFTHFDIREYEKPLRNDDRRDDNKLISLYKLLSPEHLLKLPFANDSNTLDKAFYTELLHIIGLIETKVGGKKLIERRKEGERNAGSLIENAIIQLDSLDKISRLDKPFQFGETTQERLFNIGLELAITWVDRILFLKLLEAQLINYHKGDKSYAFLNTEKVSNFDGLNTLFFQVLAKKQSERNQSVKAIFANVPYLNSSLFEPTEIEHSCFPISQLKDEKLPILSSTVLKDRNGKRRTGEIAVLEYIFEFLNSYDFSSEGSEEIQEENKTLINASVLGLIFEKINGYKDGSFFTPGFITMYMCRETIRRAVVQKFNEAKGWNCNDLDQLYDKIVDKKEANAIINSLKICDPAVGSGHFVVSGLNEIIAIKSYLKILLDRQGKTLRDYHVEVVNDELIVTDEDGELFEYNPHNQESQRIQEALFHEKQTIIENCLFGVDINPNSVKICRLRLWIELLKNAYYTAQSNYTELETLPNIDINIKCGNSLISRYSLDADIKTALKKSKWSIDSYRAAVMTYRNAQSKDVKRSMEKLIEEIKNDFEKEIAFNDKRVIRLPRAQDELLILTKQNLLFEQTASEKAHQKKQERKINDEIKRLKTEIEDIKSNKIYENAFEWRFEFPEVLNDDGEFVGFDIVIGNPPYKMIQPHNTTQQEIDYMRSAFPFADFKIDLFHLFFQQGASLLKGNYYLCYIAPSTLLNNVYACGLREFIIEQNRIIKIAVAKEKVFDDADVHTAIYLFKKTNKSDPDGIIQTTQCLEDVLNGQENYKHIRQTDFNSLPGKVWNLVIDQGNFSIIQKILNHTTLDKYASINRGLITGDRSKYFSDIKKSENYVQILTGSDILRYSINEPKEYILFDRPKTAGGCWDKDVHLAPYKLCIRQIGTQPTATLIEQPYAVTGNIFTVVHKDKKLLKYFLAIINSQLIKYYWQIMFADFKSSFPQVTIFSLSQIPIAVASKESQHEIVQLVDQILTSKKTDPNADTSTLEKEIDQLVYMLYGLTDEEIAVVEGKG